MRYGICLDTTIAVRSEESHKSEMVSQLLFGETYLVISESKEWLKISCSFDGYAGWIDKHLAVKISEQTYTRLNQSRCWIIDKKILNLTVENGTVMNIVPGSTLPFFDPSKRIFKVEERVFILNEKPEIGSEKATADSLIKTARTFDNVPYLWGGRSLYGIDCSGFTQIVFKIHNRFIPRDAYQQADSGNPVDDFNMVKPGDLAFFSKEKSKISHVGLLIDSNHIIHASGRVRIDKFDLKGIYNEERQEYTHNLRSVRRFV